MEDTAEKMENIQKMQLEINNALCEADKKKYAFNYDEDENKERGNWSGRFDFMLSCLGYAVGLGNVWRFPYLCYKNGGGAFFIPYFIMLFFVGVPIFLLELTLGQFSSQGPLTCWEFAPIFKGLGFASLVIDFWWCLYYQVLIAWAFWYLFASFTPVLPWSECGPWSSEFCRGRLQSITYSECLNNTTMTAYVGNGTCYKNGILYGIFNETTAAAAKIASKSASNDYLNNVGLKLSQANGIGDIGPIRWDIALCLLLSWIVIFFSLCKGVKSSGKVVYFTAIFPYIVLIILFVRGITLEGYQEGIKFYITPNYSKLTDATIWKDAAVQIFFSLGTTSGGLLVLASYNRFHTDVVRDTLIVSIGNCMTSVFAGFVVFSFLGYLANASGKSVTDVVDSGVALAFIVYPEAVTLMPASPFWAIIFFIMLITLGLDSQFAGVEALVTGVIDLHPKLHKRKTLFLFILIVIFFLIGLCMCTPGGAYVLTLMDDYSGGWNIMLISCLECISVAWIYGALRFTDDIKTMVGPTVCGCIPWVCFKYWWCICWWVFAPVLLAFIMIYSLIDYAGSSYGDYEFPMWANALGWIISFSCFVAFLIPTIYTLFQYSSRKKLNEVFKPSIYWGPALVKHRELVTYVPNFVVDPKSRESFGVEMDTVAPHV